MRPLRGGNSFLRCSEAWLKILFENLKYFKKYFRDEKKSRFYCAYGISQLKSGISRLSKCISAWVLRPFSKKLNSLTQLVDTTNCYSNSLCTHFYTTRHDLWTWSKNRNFRYGRCRFLQFSKCISAWMLRPFSETLISLTLLVDTTNWNSNSLCTHFYITRHDLWTWSKNRNFGYGRCPIFAIFKMHLRLNAPAVFRETPLTYSTRGYCKLVE